MENASRSETVKRVVKSIIHARQCENPQCPKTSCRMTKRTFAHMKSCTNRAHGTCELCKLFVGFCTHHAKGCQTEHCIVPFCKDTRRILAHQVMVDRDMRTTREMTQQLIFNVEGNQPNNDNLYVFSDDEEDDVN